MKTENDIDEKIKEYLKNNIIVVDADFVEKFYEPIKFEYFFPYINKLPFWWCFEIYKYFDNIKESSSFSEIYENYVYSISTFLLELKGDKFNLVPLEKIWEMPIETISKLFLFISEQLNIIDPSTLVEKNNIVRKLTLVKKETKND